MRFICPRLEDDGQPLNNQQRGLYYTYRSVFSSPNCYGCYHQVWDLGQLDNLKLALLWKSGDYPRTGNTEAEIELYTPQSRYRLLPNKLKGLLLRCPDLQVRCDSKHD